ncbi:non-hydrolyzing UDP-N-acetylglucosamine 2-epimerase [Paludisphaera mucosa]|uniref:UDP-N-acetylglucosamine 2-epimerase (non-hydrolyzing) n=1 Tax=Paludisphaera mucosa TaxID=3030827 RepID=A0ABT6F6E5_9BACT|nr:UDP-N-acetylglucosamine 2-epimerase (non-hydrolyzing) [Paludisphaera mucosa]MDG3003071.1 UDP-N-acetylglucosamine 2-epimerase (non-hydrolyzing) [Paludisphaera mucosa]
MDPSERRRNVVFVVGTRPEAIKTAPIIRALRDQPWARCRLIFTAQHRDLARPIFDFFDVRPDVDLDVMRPGQSLADLSNRLVVALHAALSREEPDCVVAQGDTTTVLAAALASYMLGTPFAHVEAGLRTYRLDAPYPEEANRVAASHLASLHFAPTSAARSNLLREGIPPESIHMTGNTGIDALFMAADREVPLQGLDPDSRFVLVTVHRRENLGEPLTRICEGIRKLHDRHPDVEFLWPVHPNPGVEPVVRAALGGLDRVRLISPLEYGPFVTAMKRAAFILSDSGGVQEEATALRTPVLVLRDVSEREEAVHCGVAKLVGDDPAAILHEGTRRLAEPRQPARTTDATSPFGDGRAAARIATILHRKLVVEAPAAVAV